MTRKDYVRIARAINVAAHSSPEPRSARRVGVNDCAELLAAELAADNERFDRERFLAACFEGV